MVNYNMIHEQYCARLLFVNFVTVISIYHVGFVTLSGL